VSWRATPLLPLLSAMLSNDTRLMLERWAEVHRERKRIASGVKARVYEYPRQHTRPEERVSMAIEDVLGLLGLLGYAWRAAPRGLRSALRESADRREREHAPHVGYPIAHATARPCHRPTQICSRAASEHHELAVLARRSLWRSDLVSNSRRATSKRDENSRCPSA